MIFFLNNVKQKLRISEISSYSTKSLALVIFVWHHLEKNHKSKYIERDDLRIGKKVCNRLKLVVTKFKNLKFRASGAIWNCSTGGGKIPPPCLMYHKKGPCLLRLTIYLEYRYLEVQAMPVGLNIQLSSKTGIQNVNWFSKNE